MTGSGPHVAEYSKSKGTGGQLHRPHLGYRPRLALLPPALGLFEGPCIEGRIICTGQRLSLSHEAVLARLAVERCQLLPMRREEREKWFRVECEEVGDDTLGGSVLKRQLQS
jgi:hypothetical protein